MTKLKTSSLWFYASITFYLTCMFFRSFGVHGSWSFGFDVLAFGWLGIFYRHASNLTWLANPLLFSAWILILLRKRGSALIGSSAAFVVGLLFFVLSSMDGVEIDEGGMAYPVTGYGAGYWLWLLSMGCALSASLQLNFSGSQNDEVE